MNIRRSKVARQHSRSGFTFVELLTSIGASTLMFLAVTAFYVCSCRMLHILSDFNDLDQMNRYAIDQMSRDVRSAKALMTFSTNQLVFSNASPSSFTYTYSPSAGTLTRAWGGTTSTLLSNISALTFDISQRNPSNNFVFYSANGVAANAKLISVTWTTYKTMLGRKWTTEEMQTANIVMRN